MRHIYTAFFYLLTPFILLRLYWKGRRTPAYRQRILERFALGKTQSTEVDVWVHTVSLGEVIAAIPLIDELLAKQWRVLVTTMTPTGSERVAIRFGDRVAHHYMPYDMPWVLRRFFKKINARVGIIMETELWPNLIYQAHLNKLPLIIANARISDKAYKQYRKVAFLFKPILKHLSSVLAQSEEDARRFISLGASQNLVSVCGNMKFDLQSQVPDRQKYEQCKHSWGSARPVIIAASTHDNEEKQLLTQLPTLKAAIPNVLLLIAPRHPERFQTVYQQSCQMGINTALRSKAATISTDTEVIVIDSLGELLGFYQESDYAFVGGSLIPIGGHNVLEPIAMHVPVFTGPFMQNSKAICRDLCAAGAMHMSENANDLIAAIIMMHQDESRRLQQITNADLVLKANKGSVQRHMEKIVDISGL